MIAIFDYGVGNLKSIENMLSRLGINSCISSKMEDIKAASGIILPGVGSFDTAITELENKNYFYDLREVILQSKKYVLGICLGSQILGKISEEGTKNGLCLVNIKSKRFDNRENLPVPHMGWNSLDITRKSRILGSVTTKDLFYFCHSYYMVSENTNVAAGWTNYGIRFCSVIEENNIFGVQFHPEKSLNAGLKIFRNFASICYAKE